MASSNAGRRNSILKSRNSMGVQGQRLDDTHSKITIDEGDLDGHKTAKNRTGLINKRVSFSSTKHIQEFHEPGPLVTANSSDSRELINQSNRRCYEASVDSSIDSMENSESSGNKSQYTNQMETFDGEMDMSLDQTEIDSPDEEAIYSKENANKNRTMFSNTQMDMSMTVHHETSMFNCTNDLDVDVAYQRTESILKTPSSKGRLRNRPDDIQTRVTVCEDRDLDDHKTTKKRTGGNSRRSSSSRTKHIQEVHQPVYVQEPVATASSSDSRDLMNKSVMYCEADEGISFESMENFESRRNKSTIKNHMKTFVDEMDMSFDQTQIDSPDEETIGSSENDNKNRTIFLNTHMDMSMTVNNETSVLNGNNDLDVTYHQRANKSILKTQNYTKDRLRHRHDNTQSGITVHEEIVEGHITTKNRSGVINNKRASCSRTRQEIDEHPFDSADSSYSHRLIDKPVMYETEVENSFENMAQLDNSETPGNISIIRNQMETFAEGLDMSLDQTRVDIQYPEAISGNAQKNQTMFSNAQMDLSTTMNNEMYVCNSDLEVEVPNQQTVIGATNNIHQFRPTCVTNRPIIRPSQTPIPLNTRHAHTSSYRTALYNPIYKPIAKEVVADDKMSYGKFSNPKTPKRKLPGAPIVPIDAQVVSKKAPSVVTANAPIPSNISPEIPIDVPVLSTFPPSAPMPPKCVPVVSTDAPVVSRSAPIVQKSDIAVTKRVPPLVQMDAPVVSKSVSVVPTPMYAPVASKRVPIVSNNSAVVPKSVPIVSKIDAVESNPVPVVPMDAPVVPMDAPVSKSVPFVSKKSAVVSEKITVVLRSDTVELKSVPVPPIDSPIKSNNYGVVSKKVPDVSKGDIGVSKNVPAAQDDTPPVLKRIPVVALDTSVVLKSVSPASKGTRAASKGVPVVPTDVAVVSKSVSPVSKGTRAVSKGVPVVLTDVAVVSKSVPLVSKGILAVSKGVPVVPTDVAVVSKSVSPVSKGTRAVSNGVLVVPTDVAVVSKNVSNVSKNSSAVSKSKGIPVVPMDVAVLSKSVSILTKDSPVTSKSVPVVPNINTEQPVEAPVVLTSNSVGANIVSAVSMGNSIISKNAPANSSSASVTSNKDKEITHYKKQTQTVITGDIRSMTSPQPDSEIQVQKSQIDVNDGACEIIRDSQFADSRYCYSPALVTHSQHDISNFPTANSILMNSTLPAIDPDHSSQEFLKVAVAEVEKTSKECLQKYKAMNLLEKLAFQRSKEGELVSLPDEEWKSVYGQYREVLGESFVNLIENLRHITRNPDPMFQKLVTGYYLK